MVHCMADNMLWIRWPLNPVGSCLIHESQHLYVEQHDLRIKALNIGNTYASMRSTSYLSCRQTYAYIQGVTRVNPDISTMLQGNSFPVHSHMHVWIGIDNQSIKTKQKRLRLKMVNVRRYMSSKSWYMFSDQYMINLIICTYFWDITFKKHIY